MMKNKKGFTIIELIVVIAIIGILVLLATPRLIGYVNKTQLTRIMHDVKVAENVAGEELALNDEFPDKWESADFDKLTELAGENKLYHIKGLVIDEEIEKDDYVIIPNDSINTKLKGNFYANQGGKVYYEDLKSGKIDNGNKPEGPNDGENPDLPEEGSVDKEDLINKKEEAEGLNPDDYEDFTDVENAINEADKIIKDEDATQEEVDEALKDLEDAMDGLEEKPVEKTIDELIEEGWIPIATNNEFNQIRNSKQSNFGQGTKWAGSYMGGPDKNYVQVQDVNLNSFSNFVPIPTFAGSYNGKNYSITGLNIIKSNDKIGLFETISNDSIIENMNISNVNIDAKFIVGGYMINNVGSLTGVNNGIIKNVHATGIIKGDSTNNAGGLIGTNNGSVINSSAKVSISGFNNVGGIIGWNKGDIETSFSDSEIEGIHFAQIDNLPSGIGGLIGEQYDGSVLNSYSLSKVTGAEETGGLIGNLRGDGKVTNSYSAGYVVGYWNDGIEVGGLIDKVSKKDNIINSYYDIKISNQKDNGNGIAKQTNEMKQRSTFEAWDFNSIWHIDENLNYPILLWQNK